MLIKLSRSIIFFFTCILQKLTDLTSANSSVIVGVAFVIMISLDKDIMGIHYRKQSAQAIREDEAIMVARSLIMCSVVSLSLFL